VIAPNGVPCCDISDGHRTTYEVRAGAYWVSDRRPVDGGARARRHSRSRQSDAVAVGAFWRPGWPVRPSGGARRPQPGTLQTDRTDGQKCLFSLVQPEIRIS
jgi:hypothetical protein